MGRLLRSENSAPLQRLAQGVADLVDVLAFGHERGCEDYGVGRHADDESPRKEPPKGRRSTRTRPIPGCEIDPGKQPVAADVLDDGKVPKSEDALLEIGRQFGRTLENPFFSVDALGGEAGGTGERMR